jgi:hypothetical protein
LVDFLIQGNYRDTASTLAGITARSVRGWMDAAEKGDPRYEPVAQLIRVAEALAESTAVRNVRAAGKDPRFWAAEMTYLERKNPDRWARRPEDTSTPRVVVQVGINVEDVKVTLDGGSIESNATPSLPFASTTIK